MIDIEYYIVEIVEKVPFTCRLFRRLSVKKSNREAASNINEKENMNISLTVMSVMYNLL